MPAKIDAIAIILESPLWPQRSLLGNSGQALFDAIVAEAKTFALHVAEERFGDALEMLGQWGRVANEFIDATLIFDPDPSIAEANRRMIAVFRYYCDASGYDFSQIQRRAAA